MREVLITAVDEGHRLGPFVKTEPILIVRSPEPTLKSDKQLHMQAREHGF